MGASCRQWLRQQWEPAENKRFNRQKKVAHMPSSSSANCEITTFIIFLRMGTPGTNFSFLHFELNTVFTCSAKADWSSVVCYWFLEAQASTPRLVSFRSLIQNFQWAFSSLSYGIPPRSVRDSQGSIISLSSPLFLLKKCLFVCLLFSKQTGRPEAESPIAEELNFPLVNYCVCSSRNVQPRI